MGGGQDRNRLGRRYASMVVVLVLVLVLAVALGAAASPAPPLGDRDVPLAVGVVATPPFAMSAEGGGWTGLSIDVWSDVATRLGLRYELRSVGLEEAFTGIADGSLDVALGPISLSPEGEERFDFTHPYYSAGVGVALPRNARHGWGEILWEILQSRLVHLVLALAAGMIVVGSIVWLLEREHNAAQFGGSTIEGIATGIWWAAVTMTTVGYGDAAPRTRSGRIVALLWMFVSVVAVASFTAAVTSALTLSHLRGVVRSASDLAHVRVGAVQGSADARYLQGRGVAYAGYPTIEEALSALSDGKLDAVTSSIPTLRAEILAHWDDALVVSPLVLEQAHYAIGLPPGSPLREPLDRAILREVQDERWRAIERRYLGMH